MYENDFLFTSMWLCIDYYSPFRILHIPPLSSFSAFLHVSNWWFFIVLMMNLLDGFLLPTLFEKNPRPCGFIKYTDLVHSAFSLEPKNSCHSPFSFENKLNCGPLVSWNCCAMHQSLRDVQGSKTFFWTLTNWQSSLQPTIPLYLCQSRCENKFSEKRYC